MTPQGRALSKDRGAGFVARNWLENDGDGEEQALAYTRWTQGNVIHLSGKRAVAAFAGCAVGQIVVSSVPLDRRDLPCTVHDPETLRHTGSVAYRSGPDGPVLSATARSTGGERLWSSWPEQKLLPVPRRLAQQNIQ
jgi:competence protein ComEC